MALKTHFSGLAIGPAGKAGVTVGGSAVLNFTALNAGQRVDLPPGRSLIKQATAYDPATYALKAATIDIGTTLAGSDISNDAAILATGPLAINKVASGAIYVAQVAGTVPSLVIMDVLPLE